MSTSRRTALLIVVLFASLFALGGWRDASTVAGQVLGPHGPIADAHVRPQGAASYTCSGTDGRFVLRAAANDHRLTAWKPGFRIGHVDAWEGDLTIHLSPLPAEDNLAYRWLPPDADAARPVACGNCHGTIHEEWSASAHARSAKNPRLVTLISGEDGRGRVHETWNVSKEHALGVGVCARCHAPTYESSDLDYDLRKATGVAARGVHCDLCHKIVDVPTDKLGLRFGIDGLRFLRPKEGEQLFYGPLEDAVRPGESFGHFPIYKESRYCASCHEGKIFGVDVYTTYSEWLESPARLRGEQCQDCHMRPTGTMTNIAPAGGGIERDPWTLASHAMPGASKAMLQRSIQAEARLERHAGGVDVHVEVEARNVGHRLPTGFIDRHLLLVVEARDGEGHLVKSHGGPRLSPRLTTPGESRAGWIYGRWLIDDEGNYPLPFWLPHARDVDTRLHPEVKDERRFTFDGTVREVQVRLLYRKFWPQVSEPRGWSDQEIIVWEKRLEAK